MNVHIPENEPVITYLSRKGTDELLVSPTASSRDPYMDLGSHPDVVERVWDQLGQPLSPETRQILLGNPVLVHPITGVIFAIAWGTRYVLRLTLATAEKAKDAGLTTVETWSDGSTTDIEQELGAGWIFGRWSPEELSWLAETYAPFRNSP